MRIQPGHEEVCNPGEREQLCSFRPFLEPAAAEQLQRQLPQAQGGHNQQYPYGFLELADEPAIV
mgnify:CR=1 FL=1